MVEVCGLQSVCFSKFWVHEDEVLPYQMICNSKILRFSFFKVKIDRSCLKIKMAQQKPFSIKGFRKTKRAIFCYWKKVIID